MKQILCHLLLSLIIILCKGALWPCQKNSDCPNFRLSRCVGVWNKQCDKCTKDDDCKHIGGTKCQAYESKNDKACTVLCSTSADKCKPFKAVCKTINNEKKCRSCTTDSECQSAYNNANYKCLLVEDYTYCGVCSPNVPCPNRKLCINFDCVSCNSNSDCPADKPCIDQGCGCLSNTNCTKADKSKCDTSSGKCVGCSKDDDCSHISGAKRCGAWGKCVECKNSEDCPFNKPICESWTGSCRTCRYDYECPNNKKCVSGACSECSKDSHCTTNPNRKCKGGACVQCLNNNDCVHDTLKKFCDSTTNQCVGCNDDNPCSDGLTCDTTEQICKGTCTSNLNCTDPEKMKCNTRNGVCEPCSVDADCSHPDRPKCRNGKCIYCRSAWDCPDNLGCKDGVCVTCDDSSQCALFTCLENQTCELPTCSSPSDCSSYPDASRCETHCKPCEDHSDCNNIPNKPSCYQGSCYNCIADANCTANEFCHPTSKTCQTKTCTVDSDCSDETPICNQTIYTCDPCTSNDQCESRDPDKPICYGGECVQCTNEEDCMDFPTKQLCIDNECMSCSTPTSCNIFSDKPYCLENGACVECIDHTNCTEVEKPRCNNNVCDACDENFCPTGEYCHTSGACVECLNNTHCEEKNLSMPICELNNTCRKCIEDDDCTPLRCDKIDGSCFPPECSPTQPCQFQNASKCQDYKCVPCSSDPDCSEFPYTPYCDNGVCVECKSNTTDCFSPAKPVCIENECTQSCTGPLDCLKFVNEKICNAGACIECIASHHCPASKPVCYNSQCIPCFDDDDCFALDPQKRYCLAGKCTYCSNDTHCPSPSLAKCDNGICATCTGNTECSRFSLPNKKSVCSEGKCIICPEKCNSCNSTHCLECEDPYKPVGTECGEDCLPGMTRGANNKCAEICGDGVRRNDECDDGNNRDGDGCSSQCKIEDEWRCSGGGKYSTDTCIKIPMVKISQDKELPSVVLLKFNKPMNITTDLNLLISLSFEGVDTSLYSYELKKIDNQLIEVTFTVTQRISEPKLVISFSDPTLVKDYENLAIEQSVYTSKLHTIYYEPSSVQGISSAAGAVATTAMAATGPVLLAGANPAIIWALINLLQIFYYLLFINTEYPINLQKFLEIFSMGRLDFLPNPIEKITPNIEDELLPSPPKFDENDMNSLFLWNAGSMLLIWGIALISYGLAYLMLRYLRRLPSQILKLLSWIRENFEWSGAIRTWITSYMDLSISAFLQLQYLYFDTKIHTISSIVGILVTVLNIAFPFIVYKKVKNHQNNPQELMNKYGALIEEFNPQKKEALYCNVAILIRRALTAALLVFFQKMVYAQVFGLIIVNLAALLLLIRYKPYLNWRDLVTNITYEFFFLIIHVLIFLIAYDNHVHNFSEDGRLILGWGVIGCCLITLAITFLFIIFQQLEIIGKVIGNLKKVLNKEKKTKKKRTRRIRRANQEKKKERMYLSNRNGDGEEADSDPLKIHFDKQAKEFIYGS